MENNCQFLRQSARNHKNSYTSICQASFCGGIHPIIFSIGSTIKELTRLDISLNFFNILIRSSLLHLKNECMKTSICLWIQNPSITDAWVGRISSFHQWFSMQSSSISRLSLLYIVISWVHDKLWVCRIMQPLLTRSTPIDAALFS